MELDKFRAFLQQGGIVPGTPCAMVNNKGRVIGGFLTVDSPEGGVPCVGLHHNYGGKTGQGGTTYTVDEIVRFMAFPGLEEILGQLFVQLTGREGVNDFFRQLFALEEIARRADLDFTTLMAAAKTFGSAVAIAPR